MISKTKQLKNKLKECQDVFGTWVSFGDTQIADIMCKSNVEFLGIDLEHTSISLEQTGNIISTAHLNDVICLPRVTNNNDISQIKRVLDLGADGIIAPYVETTKQVEDLISWVKYPPKGKRSYGLNRAQDYGHNFNEYYQSWNESSLLVIQIESMKAVRDIDALIKFDEVDAVMIGPYDISGSLGIPGDIENQKVKDACATVIEACKKHNKSVGLHIVEASQDEIGLKIEMGCNFHVLSSDLFILWKWGENVRNIINNK